MRRKENSRSAKSLQATRLSKETKKSLISSPHKSRPSHDSPQLHLLAAKRPLKASKYEKSVSSAAISLLLSPFDVFCDRRASRYAMPIIFNNNNMIRQAVNSGETPSFLLFTLYRERQKKQVRTTSRNSQCTEMASNISTTITNLEQAASTEEMVKAAKQIPNFGVTDRALDQLNLLIRALSEATRWATDAASVVAWARIVEKQAKKDAFATPAMVDAFAQLAPHATTPESVQYLTNTIASITFGTTQDTKDAFSVPAIVAAFVQMAPHATTPESLRCLTVAIGNITAGTTQARKDAFATPAIVAAFVQLAPYATAAKSVRSLTIAIGNITAGTTQATKDAFATPAMVGAFVHLASHATTPESVEYLTRAIANITSGTTQATKDAFAAPPVVDTFVQLAPQAATPESVESLARAIVSITAGTTQSTSAIFSTPAVLDALRRLSSVASTSVSRSLLDAALAAVSQGDAPAAAPVAARGCSEDHLGIDCILKQALIVFPPEYRPPCNAHDAIVQCGLSGVTNLPHLARDATAMAKDRLANLPPVAAGGPCRLELDFAIAIAAYTYDLGFSSADPTGAGSDNFYRCLNAALRQRAHDGTGLQQLKPILCYLFRGLEALPAAVNVVVYRGVPSSSSALVREKYEAGKDVYWTSFTSASEKFATAVEFALKEGPGGVIFRIRSLTGRYVKWYSSMPREGEVIFSPNSSFTVWQGPHDEVLSGRTMCVVCLIERQQESVVY